MIKQVSLAIKEGDIEGRCALISVILLSLSVYTSHFSFASCSIAMAITLFFTKSRALRVVAAFLPFYILILLSGFLFDMRYALKSAFAFATLLSVGTIIYSSRMNEIAGALIFFKIPKRFVCVVQLALSIVPHLINDLNEISEVIEERRLGYYAKLLKVFVSTAILRALSFSEALFSKNFNYEPLYEIRYPKVRDFILLGLSLLLFLSTLLLNHLYALF